MASFIESLRALKVWQIAVLVAVPIVAVGVTYAAYSFATSPAEDGLEGDQQLIPVQRGDLINQVSINGSLVYSVRETLTFVGQGTVGEILVEEGQAVVESQRLAALDAASIAALEKAVAQAEVMLRDAEDTLASARDPHTVLDLAQAELKVAGAALSLRDAEEALDDLREPSASAIAKAEAAVATAQLSLQQAEDALQALLEPTPQAVASAESGVTDARVAIDEAAAALDSLRGSPTPMDIEEAQARVDSADSALANAEADLKLAQIEWNNKVQTSQDALDSAVAGYQAVMTKWLGMDLGDADFDVDPDRLLPSNGIDLDTLFNRNLRFADSSRAYWSAGPPADDPDTPWNEKTVYIWLNLWPGTILPTCDNRTVPDQGACIQKEIDDGWTVYTAARDSLDVVHIQSDKAIISAESGVTRAVDTLATAQEQMAEVEAGPGALDIEAQEKGLALAEANLLQAEEELAKLRNGPDLLEVETRKKQVAVTQADLDEAKEALAGMLQDPDPKDLAARETQLAVARASLDEAREALAELITSADPLEVALREAEVAAARSELQTALERLAGATLVAPMAGTISVISAEAGRQVNTNTAILEIVDPTVVEVDGVVDEIDVLFVRLGATASITMDALPGQTLVGNVSEIASAATSQQGVVSYALRIRMEVPEATRLPEGLSAVASVVIREDRDVLLVPVEALHGTFQRPTLRVLIDGRIVERPVVLGNSDDFWIVIEEGVAEAESVVMQVQEATTQGFGGFGQFAGGFGGGGFRRGPGGGGGAGQQRGR